MEVQKRVQLIVGAFLLLGLCALLTTIFLLGADRALFKSYSRLHAHFDQVQGLDRGSIVSLSGVVVGNVESIDFVDEKKILDVTMKVESRFMKKITVGSQVEIRTQGALGDKFVFIIPGPDDANPLTDGETLEIAKPTDIIGIVSERGRETGKVFDIISELHKMTLAINHDRKFEKMVAHLSDASANLNEMSQQIKKVTAGLAAGSPDVKLNRSLEKLENIMNKIDKGQGSLGALINDPSIHERLKALLGGSNTRKAHIKDLMRSSIEKADGP